MLEIMENNPNWIEDPELIEILIEKQKNLQSLTGKKELKLVILLATQEFLEIEKKRTLSKDERKAIIEKYKAQYGPSSD